MIDIIPTPNGDFYREDALAVGNIVTARLGDLCAHIGIYGSIRRHKPLVGDVEIVLIPHNRPQLLARLDKWLIEGQIKQKLYGKKKTPRWGEKMRGLIMHGAPVEIWLANEHNLGYTQWLRTGSANANQYVMTTKQYAKGISFDGGYVWHKDRKVYVPDEATMFALLLLPYITPTQRNLSVYQRHYANKTVTAAPRFEYVNETTPTQKGMF